MIITEIIDTVRKAYLFDTRTPYGWSSDVLLAYANEVERSAIRRAELIKDKTTPDDAIGNPLTTLSVLANTSEYDISDKIIRLIKPILASVTYPPLEIRTEDWLDDQYPYWRIATGTPSYIIVKKGSLILVPKPITVDTLSWEAVRYPLNDMALEGVDFTGSSNISFTAATKKITWTGNFLSEGIRKGYTLTISGTTNNDGDFTVKTVSRTEIIVLETLVDEANTSAHIVADCMPEIPSQHHLNLCPGICEMALKKQNEDTEQMVRSKVFGDQFTAIFGSEPSARAMDARLAKPRNRRLRSKEFGFQ